MTPLLAAGAALAASAERVVELPAAADPAAALLCVAPALCGAALASLMLGACGYMAVA